MSDIPVITVDGPSGSGKGTICAYLAHSLGWNLLDSGAVYRALAVAVEKSQLRIDDELAIVTMAKSLDLVFKDTGLQDAPIVLLQGNDISHAIRSESCSSMASKIATLPAVRSVLLQRQRNFRQQPGLVADGRDMGTIVFTDAILKIYLTASVHVRSQRRYKQLKQKGFSVSMEKMAMSIAERDMADSQRIFSPLKPADDAIVIDTTPMQIIDLKTEIDRLVRCRLQR